MEQKLRLYDIVRPTEEWIKDRMEFRNVITEVK